MLGNKHAFSEFYVCEMMHAMSTTSIEYYKQQYYTLLIGLLTADVTVSQGHLRVKHFLLPISPEVYHVLELKLGTNNEEGITQQIITL